MSTTARNLFFDILDPRAAIQESLEKRPGRYQSRDAVHFQDTTKPEHVCLHTATKHRIQTRPSLSSTTHISAQLVDEGRNFRGLREVSERAHDDVPRDRRLQRGARFRPCLLRTKNCQADTILGTCTECGVFFLDDT